MHRSRVCAVLVDTPREQAPAAAFWSAALGAPARPVPGEEQFTGLPDGITDLITAAQAVDDGPRHHLGIETDDVDAETARLLALGATEASRRPECRVPRVPGGHLLCVIPVHGVPELFATHARTRA
jgi:hypothetical protein